MAVATVALCLVHGDIGVPEQIFVIGSVGRMDCSADAGGDGDSFPPENNWLAKECTNFNRYASRGLVIREVRLQDSELIAAETGDDVSVLLYGQEPCSDRSEELVSDRVTHNVIDGLEAVQVDHMKRETAVPPARTCNLLPQTFGKEDAIRQTSHKIMMSHILETTFICLTAGDIE
jgi:hypothetical protein